MRKLLLVIVILAVLLGSTAAAFATADKWMLHVRAGRLFGDTWYSSPGAAIIGVYPTAQPYAYYSNILSTQVGLYEASAGPVPYLNKDIRGAGSSTYVWNMKLETGAAWNATDAITIGAYMPVAAEGIMGTPWVVDIYRQGVKVSSYQDDGVYGISAIKVMASNIYMAPKGIEDWQIVATAVPEPASMLALITGVMGVGGLAIRRRK